MSLKYIPKNKKPVKKDIYILGIRDGHSSGAALIKNGDVIAAISEERLTNIKNYAGVPALSMGKVFDIANLDPSEISQIAIASYIDVTPNPKLLDENVIFRITKTFAPYLHSPIFNKWAIKILQKMSPRTNVFNVLDSLGIRQKPVIFIEHHIAHAACAYFQKPWSDKTLIFTLDGMGDGISSSVSIGEMDHMVRIAESTHYDSIAANLYSEICSYLGFMRSEHEYKVMGLAPYGNSKNTSDIFRQMFRLNPNRPLEFENLTHRYMSNIQPLYRKVLVKKRFDDIAAGVQKVFEELVVQWIKNAISETGVYNVVFAGGAFLNVKANKLIRELPEVKKYFFYPAADDSGLPVGAALAGYIQYCKENRIKPTVKPIKDLYYGQEFSYDQITEILKYKKWNKKINRVSEKDTAKLLADGKVIARFSGRDEWGPRALGNRSIMGDPRNLDIVRKINIDIKQRDFWMPFSPAILEEDQPKYLKKSKFAPYMIEAFDTTSEGKNIIATLHQYDLTARPQTVNNWNPGWQKIIREFKTITGVGAILNTSFNLHGYPLVSSPDQALWTFQNSSLDGLLFEDCLITK